MIKSFADIDTERIWRGENPRKLPTSIKKAGMRKLFMLDAAQQVDDLKAPPGNQLKKLKGNLADYHSIRVNRQWRIIFIWKDDGPEEVSIVDYH